MTHDIYQLSATVLAIFWIVGVVIVFADGLHQFAESASKMANSANTDSYRRHKATAKLHMQRALLSPLWPLVLGALLALSIAQVWSSK